MLVLRYERASASLYDLDIALLFFVSEFRVSLVRLFRDLQIFPSGLGMKVIILGHHKPVGDEGDGRLKEWEVKGRRWV